MQARYLEPVSRDFRAGLVLFLITLPLCLGIALASNAPPTSGIVTGVIGGIVVGLLSGSQTSVSGPAAGLAAVVVTQVHVLGSFEKFLAALVLAGVIQIVLGLLRAGFVKFYFPTSVVKGLLTAVGILLILKQIPHVVGRDPDPIGEMSFRQPDGLNTFTELLQSMLAIQPSAAVIGVVSLALLIAWDRSRFKRSLVPAPLVVVLVGMGIAAALSKLGGVWALGSNHLVQVPPHGGLELLAGLPRVALSGLREPAVWESALTLALVASLETLLTLEGIDKLDPRKRVSPPDRELCVQGIGNIVAGFLGGLPMTSVIVRGSVNIQAGAETRLSTVLHGVLLLAFVVLMPGVLNLIPLAALAAILLMTGVKLAGPSTFRRMWTKGMSQFVPFLTTVVAIIFTDLLTGVLLGLATSVFFILRSNLNRPFRRILEKHVSGTVLRLELAPQVTFLNRAFLLQSLAEAPAGGHVVIDARSTEYIDPDVLALLHEFRQETAVARGVVVSMVGFRDKYGFQDHVQYVDVTTREAREALTPEMVLAFLKDGNERFRRGERLSRDLMRQVDATSHGQHPFAVVLACIDSRTSTELVFDLGLGDIFSVRVAGNIVASDVLGSMEYACAVAGAKLILVLGHTSCGAVHATVDQLKAGRAAASDNLDSITSYIGRSVGPTPAEVDHAFLDGVAARNVGLTLLEIRRRSSILRDLVASGRVAIVGAMYDVRSGRVDFLEEPPTAS